MRTAAHMSCSVRKPTSITRPPLASQLATSPRSSMGEYAAAGDRSVRSQAVQSGRHPAEMSPISIHSLFDQASSDGLRASQTQRLRCSRARLASPWTRSSMSRRITVSGRVASECHNHVHRHVFICVRNECRKLSGQPFASPKTAAWHISSSANRALLAAATLQPQPGKAHTAQSQRQPQGAKLLLHGKARPADCQHKSAAQRTVSEPNRLGRGEHRGAGPSIDRGSAHPLAGSASVKARRGRAALCHAEEGQLGLSSCSLAGA